METSLATYVGVIGVVDDDPAVRNSLKFSLEMDGFVVGVFADAYELLQDEDPGRFCCLVVDHHLPGMKGLELVVALRREQISVPVVLITSNPPRALVIRAGEVGVPIVEKPLLGNALLEKIRDLMASGPARPN